MIVHMMLYYTHIDTTHIDASLSLSLYTYIYIYIYTYIHAPVLYM